MKKLHALTDLQMEILNAVWERGEATVAEVREALLEQQKLSRKTVGTLMARLEKQGVLTYRVEGREHVYSATATRGEVGRATVRNILQRLFGGSVPALLSHALEAEEVHPDDLDRVREMLNTWDAEGGSHADR